MSEAEKREPKMPAVKGRSTMSEVEEREPTSEAAVVGEEVEVFSIKDDGSQILDVKQLERILLAKGVRDKPVVVISVTGRSRQGKSFLTNFLLRYADKRSKNWMGDPSAPLEGFTWRGGCDAVTKGIRFWSRVFLVKTPEGREVAVVLMDTQGTFDLESTAKDWTTIFALTTMISSVQIYNLVKDIKRDDLDQLLYFAEYAELAKEDNDGQSFQKLLFLIRDWNSPRNAAYGYEGGRAFLNGRLNNSARKHQELRALQERIWSWFEKVDCFLMPHPGLTVDSEEFDGRPSGISEDFLENINVLVTSILDPGNLLVKKIGGKEITCQDLYSFMQAFSDIFEGDKLPTPKSWREAMAEGQNLAASGEAMEIYVTGMTSMFAEDAPKRSSELLGRQHEHFRKQALHHFRAYPKMGGEDMSKRHEERIEKEIQERHEYFVDRVTSEENLNTQRWKELLIRGAIAAAGSALGLGPAMFAKIFA